MSRASSRSVVVFALLALSCRRPEPERPTVPLVTHVAPAQPVARPRLVERRAIVPTSRGALGISFLPHGTVRFEVSPSGRFEALPSFALTLERLAEREEIELREQDDLVVVEGALGRVLVDADTGRVRRLDAAFALEADFVVGEGFDASLEPETRVFGLGDKLKSFDRRGHSFEFWNTDAYGFGIDTDPLYKSFPYFVFEGGSASRALYVDSPARATVDVGKTRPDRLRYEFSRPHDYDLYSFSAASPRALIRAWTELSGRMPLPPRYTLGFHQSRYGYRSEAEIREVERRIRAANVPLDVIWLDIDFQKENAPFTVNEVAFPTFDRMIADLRARGTRVVAITDPHIAYRDATPSGYEAFDRGLAGDHFIRSPRGPGPHVDQVWPGRTVFPEFTLARTRAFWGSLYRDFVERGVSGFWNDMNEPATFGETKTFPLDVEHRLENGATVPHARVHDVYGTLNARATYEGLRALRPDTRPFVLTRAASPGAQRYAASWTGDNRSTWEHWALTTWQLASLGVSGMPFVGADVGGFVGCPEPELYASWFELGAFQPFFRNHAAHDACAREPWVFGAAIKARVKKAVERRYQLVPYLYSVFEEAARTGAPVLRPLWFEFPGDPAVRREAGAFLVGADLLVVPRPTPTETKPSAERLVVEAALPRVDWYDVASGRIVSGGERTSLSFEANESLRLFVRAGAVIPERDTSAHLSAEEKGPLTLHVWLDRTGACGGSLYWDDGESFGFERGEFRRVAYACAREGDRLRVRAESSGSFTRWWPSTRVIVHGADRPIERATSSGRLVRIEESALGARSVSLPGAPDFELDFQLGRIR